MLLAGTAEPGDRVCGCFCYVHRMENSSEPFVNTQKLEVKNLRKREARWASEEVRKPSMRGLMRF